MAGIVKTLLITNLMLGNKCKLFCFYLKRGRDWEAYGDIKLVLSLEIS
jgi:hypothetical protein